MNINDDYKNRQIIPRWYPFDYAFYLGEIGSSKKAQVSIWTPRFYKIKEQEWLRHKELTHAIDFVGTALIANDYSNNNAIGASKFILKNSKKVSNLSRQVAEKFLQLPKSKPDFNLSNHKTYREKISLLKKYVYSYPQNAIAWVDMAFYYVVLGNNEKAYYCIKVALNLAPENRFILRSASRFYLHLNNPEKALYFLRNAEHTKYDSWLLASEISISQAFDLKTSNIKIARNLLSKSGETPKDFAELFGTIGTLEIKNGKNKIAKRLFKNALIDPNENTVAQAEWITGNTNININIDRNIEAAFEANARYFFKNKEYKKSLEATIKWIRYQPFSSYPVQQATYIAGTCLANFKEVLRIVKEEASLLFDKDFAVKNNYIFSLASINRIVEAKEQIDSINYKNLPDRDKATYNATKGLIEFRKGQSEEGRRLYLDAIERFRQLNCESGVTLAKYYLIREEKRIGNDMKEMTDQVIRLAKKLGLNELLLSKILT